MRISQDGKRFVESWAARKLKSFDDVETMVATTVRVPLGQAQFDALVSLAVDLRVEDFRKSALVGKLNRGDRAGAAVEFGRFASERTARRRDAERILFRHAEYRLNQ
jgi:GH24 family phage-related lysozyme (muramidase)